MAIHRNYESDDAYFKMPVSALTDQNLSLGAIAVLGLILSLGDRAIADHELIKYGKQGREALEGYLRELISAGYIVEEPAKEFVYLIHGYEKYYKIGRSKNPLRRLDELTDAPFPFTLLHVIPSEQGAKAEKLLHKKFAHLRVRGEWFALTQTEVDWFCALDKVALEEIVDSSK